MGDRFKEIATYRRLVGQISAFSHTTTEIILKPMKVSILEMEDVLFHHDSAVMMPENPAGKSAADGSQEPSAAAAQKDQEQIAGLKALAIVFREFEFDPEKRLLIVGHTDTSGQPKYNFELSELRAQNVLYLLTGERAEWAKVCFERHKVEDYQQVLAYVKKTRKWLACDPQGLDNKWGVNTENATRAFISSYNQHLAPKYGTLPLSETLIDRIKADGQKRWPVELWEAAFDIYNEDLAAALEVKVEELERLRRTLLLFVDDSLPFVGCGESFPIDQKQKSNYRSQANRRVELLFFDKDEIPFEKDGKPGLSTCPTDKNATHKEADCPLWHRYNLIPLYIKPEDLTSTVFHLKFSYFNEVRQELKAMPEIPGLRFRALESKATPAGETFVEIPTETKFKKDVYFVKLTFPDALSKHPREKLHFEFTTVDTWIFTESQDKKKEPEAVIVPSATVTGAPLADRVKYYDVPAAWDSRNWQCELGDKNDVFEKLVKEKTSPTSPLVFCLDDLVLVDGAGAQNVRDRNGRGDPRDLANDQSRVRLLTVDPADNLLTLYEAKAGERCVKDAVEYEEDPSNPGKKITDASKFRFQKGSGGQARNFIRAPGRKVRAVVFCGDFYDVARRRTGATAGFNFSSGHVLGARAAMPHDPQIHGRETIGYNTVAPLIHSADIGDFDLHYLHEYGCDGETTFSCLIVYWSTYVIPDTNPTNGVGDKAPATVEETREFVTVGMTNAMAHWNRKNYQFEDHAKVKKHIVKPLFIFDANENFWYIPASPVNIKAQNYSAVFQPAFETRMRDTLGGVPKSVTFVTEEDKGSWFLSSKGGHSLLSILSARIKTRNDDNTRFPGAGFPISEFGEQYGCLALAHELGHATGQVDDYMETGVKIGQDSTDPTKDLVGQVPTYRQFGYNDSDQWIEVDNSDFADREKASDSYDILHDGNTIMVKNGPVRMRQLWRFARWLNERGKTGKPLNPFLAGTQFEIYHPRSKMRYFREGALGVNPWSIISSAALDVKPKTGRTMGVYLFKGLDETRLLRATPPAKDLEFKAILAVRVLLSITYVNDSPHVWQDLKKKEWARTLRLLFFQANLAGTKGKFYLTGGGGDLDPTIIRFLPGFDFYEPGDSPAHTSYNYRVEVKANSPDPITQAGDVIKLGDKVPRLELFNYFFLKPAASTTFVNADFDFIKTWFSGPGIGNGPFRIETI